VSEDDLLYPEEESWDEDDYEWEYEDEEWDDE